MNRLIHYLFVIGMISLFVLSGPLLNFLGWGYVPGPYGDTGSAVTKIHLATYIFGLTAVLALLSLKRRPWNIIRDPFFLAFLCATAVVIGRALFIASASDGEVSGGELSTAIVSFGTPAAMLFCLPSDRRNMAWMTVSLRLFFVANSFMAITERVIDHRFIPSFLDMFNEHRSAALFGHPLAGALLTGMILINLVISPRRNIPFSLRLFEIIINVFGMIAFGGRAALVFLPLVISAAALFLRNNKNEGDISITQRLMPIALIVLGILLLTLPIPFIDATLSRFFEDNGSAATRTKAISILLSLDLNSIISGLNAADRHLLMSFYNTTAGIELVWVNLIIIFGLPITLCLAAGLLAMLWRLCRNLDRSAKVLALYFLLVTAGSVGFSSKSVLIAQLVGMITILCRTGDPLARATAVNRRQRA